MFLTNKSCEFRYAIDISFILYFTNKLVNLVKTDNEATFTGLFNTINRTMMCGHLTVIRDIFQVSFFVL
jgi:hypothetical protein